jgi:HEAT repeat protein
VAKLVEQLEDDSPGVRQQAMEGLSKTGAKRLLRRALAEAEDPEVKSRLGQLLRVNPR